MALAGIQATFSEWRMVKGRKVLQLVFEVPLEQQQDVLNNLGAPMPDAERWFAIAPFADGKKQAEPEASASDGEWPLAKHAGFLCSKPTFRLFLAEKDGRVQYTVEEAAEVVRQRCGVKSRTELNTNALAARFFRNLRADYDNWMRGAA